MTFLQLALCFLLFLPGFGITFLIGWKRRQHGKPTFLKISFWSALIGALDVIVVILALIGFMAYALRTRVVDHSGKPLTVVEARQLQCPIPLPNSAKNIRFACASGGIVAYELLVRFEASPDVCRAQVQTIINAQAAQGREKPYTARFRSLISTPRVESDMIGNASWFDIPNIVHGETAETPPFSDDQFWIDNDRGIFYYKLTD